MPTKTTESQIDFMIKWIWHLLQKTERACAASHTDVDGNCLRCRSLEAARGMLMERPDSSLDKKRIEAVDELLSTMLSLAHDAVEVDEVPR